MTKADILKKLLLGKVFPRVNAWSSRYSLVGDTPFLDSKRFPWVRELESNWSLIPKQLEGIIRYREKLPNIQDISREQLGLTDDDLWKIYILLALVITATGLAGVMALLVNQRTQELGIRLALGATPRKILLMVLRQGLTLVALGLALGFAGAMALRRVMSGLLFAVEPGDPLTWLVVSLALAAVAAVACFAPARRVTLIDPLKALRSE